MSETKTKHLFLTILTMSVILFGACAPVSVLPAPTPASTSALTPAPEIDKPRLSEAEMCQYIWAYKLYSFPSGYTKENFNPETMKTSYKEDGVWSFEIRGFKSDIESSSNVRSSPIRWEALTIYQFWSHNLPPNVITFGSPDDDSEIVTEYQYELLLTATYYESIGVLTDPIVHREDMQHRTVLRYPSGVIDLGMSELEISKPLENIPIRPILAWVSWTYTYPPWPQQVWHGRGYELQIAKDSMFTNIVKQTGLVEFSNPGEYPCNTHQIRTDLDYNTTYYWRVRGVTYSGYTDWSYSIAFITEAEPQ